MAARTMLAVIDNSVNATREQATTSAGAKRWKLQWSKASRSFVVKKICEAKDLTFRQDLLLATMHRLENGNFHTKKLVIFFFFLLLVAYTSWRMTQPRIEPAKPVPQSNAPTTWPPPCAHFLIKRMFLIISKPLLIRFLINCSAFLCRSVLFNLFGIMVTCSLHTEALFCRGGSFRFSFSSHFFNKPGFFEGNLWKCKPIDAALTPLLLPHLLAIQRLIIVKFQITAKNTPQVHTLITYEKIQI